MYRYPRSLLRWSIRTLKRNFISCVYLCAAVLGLNIIGIPKLIRQIMVDPNTIEYFTQKVTDECNGHFRGFVHQFAHLKRVVVDPAKAEGRPGGEDIYEVLPQEEHLEYFKLSPGYFRLPCQKIPNYYFWSDSHLNKWLEVVLPQSIEPSARGASVLIKGNNFVQKTFTIAITRFEYANLYHVISDLYNAYIMTRVFDRNPSETNILLIDAHPKGLFDGVWTTLFDDVTRAGRVEVPVVYENLVWNIAGIGSHLHLHDKVVLPEVEGFIEFVLRGHQVALKQVLDCSNITIRFIWRRNYLTEPRDPIGFTDRKISNEQELVKKVQMSLKQKGKITGTVDGVRLEILDFADQLRVISQTDILIGVHGSGLSHTLFLPRHAALIELFTLDIETMLTERRYRTMARWRRLHYFRYQNPLQENELSDGWTKFVASDIVGLVLRAKRKMCGNSP